MTINPGSRIACVLVGLPGTSKTLVAQKDFGQRPDRTNVVRYFVGCGYSFHYSCVCRYLQWLGIASKVFNVGNYRRKLFGAHQPHLFFDSTNQEGIRSRSEAHQEALAEMISWFHYQDEQEQEQEQHSGAAVAILDATNSTRARRDSILHECHKNNVQVMFIESVFLEDEAMRLANAVEIQRWSPDYALMQPDLALEDFKARTSHYAAHYETLTVEQDRDLTFIKLVDAGSQVIIHQIRGYLQSRVVYYLMNLRIAPRKIYFSRHGESLYNVMGLLGGDSDLSARGKQYARALPLLIATHIPNADRLAVWTSTKKRTIATAQHLPHAKLAWKALDELEAGKADGLTYEQVEEQFPEDFANRDNDKYNYRYQDGESYRDVVARLEPVLMNLERQTDILIIGHQAILRCLYAYFMNYSHERLPYIKIPLHTLIQLTPGAYKCEEQRFKVDIEAVDTHRPKPKAGGLANGADIHDHQHPHHDDPMVEATAVAMPASTTGTAEEHGKTLQSAAASDSPKIILSSLTTHTFRDSIHISANSFVSKAAAPVAAVVTAVAPTSAPVRDSTSESTPAIATTTATSLTSASTTGATPRITTVTHDTSARIEAPTSIDLPPVEEKAKMIAEALMQANAIDSLANPTVALNLDEIVTPVPEQETKGTKGPLLGLNTRLSCSIDNDGSSIRSLETVATPPMSPVPSKDDDRRTDQISVAHGEQIKREGESSSSPIAGGVTNSCPSDGIAHSSKDASPIQLSNNPQALAAICV